MRASTKLIWYAIATLIVTYLAALTLIALGVLPLGSVLAQVIQWIIWIEVAAVSAAVAWRAVLNLYTIICTLLDTVGEPVLWLASKATKRKK